MGFCILGKRASLLAGVDMKYKSQKDAQRTFEWLWVRSLKDHRPKGGNPLKGFVLYPKGSRSATTTILFTPLLTSNFHTSGIN